ncbi:MULTISPECIES: hypothetical protein [unclassified Corynebacterium]|uniref:hypothetical protein n=1 Tax=unclassified Corynebacterium TaxID=2624378 RepID=UPI00265361C1|nr:MULTISPECIES: hypothetical protein [unclassified Corynebacterium]MDN8594603.1 hypothetical protein [Corynebacterium sp. P4_F2]WKK55554.1 hypothetical protein QYR03_10375 [Corynebacterium sp. P4-C1]WKK62964.1 hypothetical protein QYR04_09070 [Corynebacterium sp. P8-C1]
MTIRRLTAAFFALTLPLAAAACGTDDENLAEPDLTSAPETSSTAEGSEKETSSERPSTTVSTVYESADDDADDAEDEKKKEEEQGSEKGPCHWTPMEEGTPGEEVSVYCDGRFAKVGSYATDATSYMRWDGKEWAGIESAGTSYTGFKCYDEAQIDELGVPAELKEQMILCD